MIHALRRKTLEKFRGNINIIMSFVTGVARHPPFMVLVRSVFIYSRVKRVPHHHVLHNEI